MADKPCTRQTLGHCKGPQLHDQAAKLRDAVGDVPDPEDSIDYDGLKASMAGAARRAELWVRRCKYDVGLAESRLSMCQSRLDTAIADHGYLVDVVGVHDIDIPEEGE